MLGKMKVCNSFIKDCFSSPVLIALAHTEPLQIKLDGYDHIDAEISRFDVSLPLVYLFTARC